MSIYTLYLNLSQEKKFYVYTWLRSRQSKNGDIGTPYYIGKGTGDRAFKKTRKFIPKDKSFIKIISDSMSEMDSFQLEMLLIYQYGRIDLGTGCLKNLNEGGYQPPNCKGKKKSASFCAALKLRMTGNTLNVGKRRSKEANEKQIQTMKGRRQIKFIDAQIIEIRKEFDNGILTQKELAIKYGIRYQYIN